MHVWLEQRWIENEYLNLSNINELLTLLFEWQQFRYDPVLYVSCKSNSNTYICIDFLTHGTVLNYFCTMAT